MKVEINNTEKKIFGACKDIVRLMEFKYENCTKFLLYKTIVIDSRRYSHGWCYFLIADGYDGEYNFPIVITEETANDILKNPEIGHNLISNRISDRIR